MALPPSVPPLSDWEPRSGASAPPSAFLPPRLGGHGSSPHTPPPPPPCRRQGAGRGWNAHTGVTAGTRSGIPTWGGGGAQGGSRPARGCRPAAPPCAIPPPPPGWGFCSHWQRHCRCGRAFLLRYPSIGGGRAWDGDGYGALSAGGEKCGGEAMALLPCSLSGGWVISRGP